MSDASHFGTSPSGEARETSESVGQTVDDLSQSAKTEARRLADRQKSASAEQIAKVAHAVRGAADDVEAELPQAADYIRWAAKGLENASTALRENSVDELVHRASQFARSRPATFFGGAIVAGIALSRFLKSSGERTAQSRQAAPGSSTTAR